MILCSYVYGELPAESPLPVLSYRVSSCKAYMLLYATMQLCIVHLSSVCRYNHQCICYRTACKCTAQNVCYCVPAPATTQHAHAALISPYCVLLTAAKRALLTP
jgi:hypothetical protein